MAKKRCVFKPITIGDDYTEETKDYLQTIFSSDNEYDDVLYVDDITGTLGQWFDMDTSDINPEAIKHLQEAYNILT